MSSDDELIIGDEMLPNDGSYFYPKPSKEVERAEREERQRTTSSVPVLSELIEWFDTAIAVNDSIDTLELESKTPIEVQVLAQQRLKTLLRSKRDEVVAMRDKYVPHA